MAHIGEERTLGAAGFFGLLALLVRFARQRLDAVFLRFSAGQRIGEPPLVAGEVFFLALQRGDIDANGHQAAIGGAALDQVKPHPAREFDDAHFWVLRVVLLAANARRGSGGNGLVGSARPQQVRPQHERLGEAAVPQ